MRRWFPRLFGWTSDSQASEVLGYRVSFSGQLATWPESVLEVTSMTFDAVVDDDPVVDVQPWILHNPGDVAFPAVTARFRFPDRRVNDLLVYSESSQSYAVIKRHETPAETADLVERLRSGWTYQEATRGH